MTVDSGERVLDVVIPRPSKGSLLPKKEDPEWVKVPKSWGRLPETAPWREVMEWVMVNLRRCRVRGLEGGENTTNLHVARSKAPSETAIGMLEWAVTDRKAFMSQYARTMGVEEGEGVKERDRRERKRIDEIEAVLEQLREVKGCPSTLPKSGS